MTTEQNSSTCMKSLPDGCGGNSPCHFHLLLTIVFSWCAHKFLKMDCDNDNDLFLIMICICSALWGLSAQLIMIFDLYLFSASEHVLHGKALHKYNHCCCNYY